MPQNVLLIVADELVDLAKEASQIDSGVLPPKAQALTQTLGSVANDPSKAVVTWPLSQKQTVPLDGYTLDIAASESFTFNAADKWADGDPAAGTYLSIAAAGALSLKGAATIPSGYAKLGLTAQASLNIALTYFFQAPATQTYGKAVAACLVRLADPFDFASVWAQSQTADFQGLRFSFDGAAKVSVQVTVADALSPAVKGVTAGATVNVSAGVDSTYALELRRITQGGAAALHAKLARKAVTDADFSASLGVVVDLSSLTQGVSAALTNVVSQWDAALKPIEDLLSPGTWLRTKLAAQLSQDIKLLVKDPGLQQALIGDAQGVLGIKALESDQVETWLAGAVGGAIDRSSVLIKGAAVQQLQPVLAELAKVAPSLATQAQTELTATLTKALTAIDDKAKTVVGSLVPFKPDIVSALNKAGVAVTGAVDTVDKAFAPIRDLLTKVDKQFHDVFAQAQTALKQKVTAKLSVENSRSDSTDIEFAGVFNADSPEARQLFSLLTLGQMHAVADLIAGGQPTPGFTVEDATVTRLINSKETQGLDITFLDFTLSWSELLTTKTQTIVDSNGNVRVLSEGDITKELKTPFSTRGASFVDSYSVVQARATKADPAAGPAVLQMGAEAYFLDANLVWNKIDDFLQSLDSFDLISGDAHGKIRAVFNSWAGPSAKISGRLSASLRLSGKQIDALLPSDPFAADYQRTIVIAAYNAELRGGDLDPRAFTRGQRLVMGEFPKPHPPSMSYPDVVLQLHDQFDGTVYEPDPITGAPSDSSDIIDHDDIDAFEQFVVEARVLKNLADLTGAMSALYHSSPGPGGWDAARYAKNQQAVVDNAEPWLTVTPPLIEFFSGRITRRTLAFMRALADLAGLPNQPAVTLTLTCTPASGDPKVAAFQ